MRRYSDGSRRRLAVAGVALTGLLLSGCGSVQLSRGLSRAERAEVQAASVPAVVGIRPWDGAEELRTALDEAGLFERVELLPDLAGEPDLILQPGTDCEAKDATYLMPVFTWMTLGFLPTWGRFEYGHELIFHAPGTLADRVTVGCGTGGTMVFGWVGTAMNVLPRWTLTTEPHKKPRYTRRAALEVAKRADELRLLLGMAPAPR